MGVAHLLSIYDEYKSHLKAIYAKLDVRGRPGAVARARELGLLK